MTDERAHTSDASADGNTRRRQIDSSSESDDSVWSVDSVFSPPAKRYKLRATTPSGCVFGGKSLSAHGTSTSGSSCNVLGPSTSYWGPEQTNRLNFQKPMYVAPRFDYSGKQNILRFVCEPFTGHGELPGPEIVTTAVKEKLMEACTGNPVLRYIEKVLHGIYEKDISLVPQGEENFVQIQTFLTNKILKDKESHKKFNIPEILFKEMMKCLKEVFRLCYLDKKPEILLDRVMVAMMQLVQAQEDIGWFRFQIRERLATEIKFDICGEQVTSMTHLVWEIEDVRKMLPNDSPLPILLSENKGSFIERVKRTAHHTTKKNTSWHLKISQVIGQCISMAERSAFETEDYKIVYHVSLMNTSRLVITRTHVAKSTLRVIKDGCPIPDRNDLDPSYVLEYCCLLSSDVRATILTLYTTLLIFKKLAYMQVCEKPEDEGEKTN